MFARLPPGSGCSAADELHGAIALVDDRRAIADAERDLDVLLHEQNAFLRLFPRSSTPGLLLAIYRMITYICVEHNYC
jgi:hypothetical protein